MVPLFDFSTSYPGTTPDPKHKLPFLNCYCLAFRSRPQEDVQVEAEWVSCMVWLCRLVETDGASRALLGYAALGMGESQRPGSQAREEAPWPSAWERLPSWSCCELGQSFLLHLHMGAVWARLFCIRVLGTVLYLEGYRVESLDTACQVWPGARLHPPET